MPAARPARRLAALCAWALGGLEVEAAGAAAPAPSVDHHDVVDYGDWPCPATRPACAGAPPLVAFLIAGEARGFAERYAASLKKYVLDDFGAHPDSALLLVLTGAERRNETTWASLRRALRPAVVEFVPDAARPGLPLESHYARLHHNLSLPGWPSQNATGLHHKASRGFYECVNGTRWADAAYAAAVDRWWGTMRLALNLLEARERAIGRPYDFVFFARPDVRYLSGFGPWCGYDATTWYSGGHGAPDMLWYMPRGVAADVLNSLDALYGCAGPGHLCCIKDYSSREVEPLRSYWALWYWRAAKGYALSTRLRGNASVVGHHTRVGGRGIYIGCGHRSRPGAGVVEELFGPDVWPAP